MLWMWQRLKLAHNVTSPFEISVNLGATKSLSCWLKWINNAAPKNKLKKCGRLSPDTGVTNIRGYSRKFENVFESK